MSRHHLAPRLLLAAAVALALFALAGYQVTGPTAGPRFLGRLVGAMVEIDRWLPAHRADIEQVAVDRSRLEIVVPEFAVPVTIRRSAVVQGDSDLGVTIISAVGEVVYRDGRDAFSDGSSLGLDEPARWTIEMLQESNQSLWRLLTLITGLSVLVLATFVILGSGRPTPFALLPPVLLGAVVFGVAAFGVWIMSHLASSLPASAANREVLLILQDSAWLALRNALAVAGAAAVIYVLSRLAHRQTDTEDVAASNFGEELV